MFSSWRTWDGGRWPRRLAAAALCAVMVAACGDGAATGPSMDGRPLTGEWAGGGSLFHEVGWSLVQHRPGDSLTGTGFLDAPSFLDGQPAGPNPRYRIRGQRNGLFFELTLVPEDSASGAFPLHLRGMVLREGLLRGEVLRASSGHRLDLVRAVRDGGS